MVTRALSLMSAPRRIRSAEVKRVNELNWSFDRVRAMNGLFRCKVGKRPQDLK